MEGGQRTCRHVHRHFMSSTLMSIVCWVKKDGSPLLPEGSSLAHYYCTTFELVLIKGHAIIACKEGAWE